MEAGVQAESPNTEALNIPPFLFSPGLLASQPTDVAPLAPSFCWSTVPTYLYFCKDPRDNACLAFTYLSLKMLLKQAGW